MAKTKCWEVIFCDLTRVHLENGYYNIVHMPTKKEIERRFLVKFPDSWEKLSELFEDLIDIKRINQTYLKPKGDEPAPRVRKTIEGLSDDTKVVYDFNQKTPLETGTHKELEREITEKEYNKYLDEPYPGKGSIEKTRFVFRYHDQTFELDVFKGKLKGLAILELELEDIDETVELPPFLEVIKEVTKDKSFNNFSLADKTKKK
jgi:CYTH domain-containing protein